ADGDRAATHEVGDVAAHDQPVDCGRAAVVTDEQRAHRSATGLAPDDVAGHRHSGQPTGQRDGDVLGVVQRVAGDDDLGHVADGDVVAARVPQVVADDHDLLALLSGPAVDADGRVRDRRAHV